MTGKNEERNMRSIYTPEPATLLENQPVTELERRFRFTMDSGKSLGHKPGQFVQVSVPGFGEAPISISSSPAAEGPIELIVRRAGRVTIGLHNLAAGERIGIRGPFGTSFPVESEMKGRDILFIAGGIGLVPLRSAIDYVLAKREQYGRVFVLYGTKAPSERLLTDRLDEWRKMSDVQVLETVDHADEGWSGHVGVITTLLPEIAIDAEKTTALLCGPPIMYKFVIAELRRMKVSDEQVYVSLERHMKCGVGKCGHCQVNGHYACQEGPVFRFADVAELAEAIH